MASRKKGRRLAQYCRIYQYIDYRDPELAGAIRGLCMERALSPGRRNPGITFLYPEDDKYRNEIVDLTYSQTASDGQKAIEMVESLIIPDLFLSAPEFTRRAVGSRLGVKFDVKEASGKKVVLDGGVELALAADFRTGRDNLAVWIITKGRVPTKGKEYSPPRRERERKTGGAPPAAPGGNTLINRAKIAAAAENEYAAQKQKDEGSSFNPYLSKAVSLLNFLQEGHPDLFQMVLPLLDLDPTVTFYLLVEPYKTSGGYLIPDSVILAWGDAIIYQNALSEYKAFFSSLPARAGSSDPSFVLRDQDAVWKAIDIVRQHITDPGQANKIQLPANVRKVYDNLSKNNTIGGTGPILPESTLRAVSGGKKLWQDEFRFMLHHALEALYSEPGYNLEAHSAVISLVRDLRPGDNYADESTLTSAKALSANVSPNAEFQALTQFVLSKSFLYFAPAGGVIGGGAGAPTPGSLMPYNDNASKMRALERPGPMVMPEFPPGIIASVNHYIKVNGRVPPGLNATVVVPAPAAL